MEVQCIFRSLYLEPLGPIVSELEQHVRFFTGTAEDARESLGGHGASRRESGADVPSAYLPNLEAYFQF